MKNINIVAIDLPQDDESYYQLSVPKKINYLKDLMTSAYQEAKEKDPSALIVMAWHEYGIFEPANNASDKIIDFSIKNEFKKCMAKLTEELNDLIIIGGTVASAKPSKEMKNVDSKMNALSKTYEELKVIADLEPYDEYETYQQDFERNHKKPFVAVKNCCYFFVNGKQQLKQEKLLPFNEIPKYKRDDHLYRFHKNLSHLNVKLDDKEILLGEETCRDHVSGVMREFLSKKQIKKPTVQFVLSDSSEFYKENAVGDFIVHIDSDPNIGVCFYVNSDQYPLGFIKVYKIDASNADPHLIPVQGQPLSVGTYIDLVRKGLNNFHMHSSFGLIALKICEDIEKTLNHIEHNVTDGAFTDSEVLQKINDLLTLYANALNKKDEEIARDAADCDSDEKSEDLTAFIDLLRKLADYETANELVKREEVNRVLQFKKK